jgi:acyl carrier protein
MTWTRETVRAELLKVFQEHANAEFEITEKSQLVADLSIDSLGVMEVIAEIEDRFKLSIPDEALHEVETIADVARDVEVRLEREGRLQG